MADWIPSFDATLVTRILDASGIITGKSGMEQYFYALTGGVLTLTHTPACENGCYESTSETAVSGIVDNPWAKGYSAGGSSSGSASLVACGAVDMAIGCDQGG
jgi:amidase